MSEVDRLRSVLAGRGQAHAVLAGRIQAEHLLDAVVELARELVGDDEWQYVISGEKPARRRARR